MTGMAGKQQLEHELVCDEMLLVAVRTFRGIAGFSKAKRVLKLHVLLSEGVGKGIQDSSFKSLNFCQLGKECFWHEGSFTFSFDLISNYSECNSTLDSRRNDRLNVHQWPIELN